MNQKMKQKKAAFLSALILSSSLLLDGNVASNTMADIFQNNVRLFQNSKHFFQNNIPEAKARKAKVDFEKTNQNYVVDSLNLEYLKRCECSSFLNNSTALYGTKNRKLNRKLNIGNAFLAEDNFSYIYGDSSSKEKVVSRLCRQYSCPRRVIISLFWDSAGYHKIRDPISGKPVFRDPKVPIDYD